LVRNTLKVLIACEYSGTVRDAFIKAGHEAMSCDLLPSDRPGPHYQGNVLDLLETPGRWDIMIAHPPCTYLCNSGVRWLYKEGEKQLERWENMVRGAYFMKQLLHASVPRICIENPVMHKHAKELVGALQSQTIQPWMFGHGETKATCLWLRNLPLLKPTNIVDGREARIHKLPPSVDRWKIRSTTYQGIADAMAEQWGSLG
jgi:hypothetical protein